MLSYLKNIQSKFLGTQLTMPILNNHKSCTHIAVLAFPFTSHPGSLLRFVRMISAVSSNTVFSFFSIASSNSSLFLESNIKGLDNIKPYNIWDGLPEGYVLSGNPLEPIELFLNTSPESFKRAMEDAEADVGQKISCLISDAFIWFSGKMAEDMNVPWVALWTSGPRSLLVHIETDMIREKLGAGVREDQTLDFLPGFTQFHASDLPDGVVFGNLESAISSMMHQMGLILPHATVVAINSFEEVDLEVVNELKKRFCKFLNVGPFSLTPPSLPSINDEHGCLEWLDKHEPASVAYISFGIRATLPTQEVAALAEALEEGGFPFLWSFRGNQDEFLDGFLERTNGNGNGKVVPWTSQAQILQHASVGVFVTHCGWNSILESVTGGVPMICRPFFGEQQLNMRTLEVVWRIGVGIEGSFTKYGALKALELVLLHEEGKYMRDRTKSLTAIAQQAVQPNGTSNVDFNTLVEIISLPKYI